MWPAGWRQGFDIASWGWSWLEFTDASVGLPSQKPRGGLAPLSLLFRAGGVRTNIIQLRKQNAKWSFSCIYGTWKRLPFTGGWAMVNGCVTYARWTYVRCEHTIYFEVLCNIRWTYKICALWRCVCTLNICVYAVNTICRLNVYMYFEDIMCTIYAERMLYVASIYMLQTFVRCKKTNV